MQGKRTNITIVLMSKIFKYGLSPVIFSFTLLVGLVVLNYVVAVKTSSFDVTKYKTNTLSLQTLTLLDDINFNVTLKAFYPDTDAHYRKINLLLDKYIKKNRRITVEFIDPLKNPVIAKEYEVTLPRTIIFETAGKQTRINPPSTGKRHNEWNITVALYRLMTDQTKTVYFTTGHGEFILTDTKEKGLNIAKEKLIEQNYLVETVNPLEEGRVPEDCSLLVIAGPKVPFIDEEAAMIKDYLDNGGSALVMVGPGIQANLDRLMRYYGLKFGDDYIYETSSKLTTEMYGPLSPFCSAQDSSEITEKLPNQNFLFPFVRSVNILFPTGDVKISRLLASSKDSWAESDMESWKTVQTNIKPSRDENEKKGPITVAVVTEREFMVPDSLATMENESYQVRSAFFGNTGFITNFFVTLFPSNMNVFLNTVNWITRNEKIIEIIPHLAAFTPVELKQSERQLLTWLTLVIFPSSILAVGFIVWYRRR